MRRSWRPRLKRAHEKLQSGSGAGGEFTGWVHLPRDYDREEFARIQAAASRIRADSQALVVIGIGGSYLGARGVIDCLRSPNYNLKHKDTPNIYFVGNGLSSDALGEVLDLVADVDFSVNVISKSGTTTEPAVAFRFFREALEKKYGREGARERIYATTDKARGALKSLADSRGLGDLRGPRRRGRPIQRADRRGPAAHCRGRGGHHRPDAGRGGDDGDLRRGLLPVPCLAVRRHPLRAVPGGPVH